MASIELAAAIERGLKSFNEAEAAKDKAAQREASNKLSKLAAQAAVLALEAGWGSEVHRTLATALRPVVKEVGSVSPALERAGWRWPEE